MQVHKQRQRPVHQPLHLRDNRPTIVFVTVCTDKRKPILARADVFEILLDSWRQSDHWSVGRFVVLPDHIHLFCAPAKTEATDLKPWVIYWRSLASRVWPRVEEQPVWQWDYWDRQLRSDESYAAKWEYVVNNPVRHGIVKCADEWPFKGEMTSFDW